MIYQLFVITGVWFWLVVLAGIIGIIASLEKEKGWWATVTFAGTILFAQLFTDANLVGYVATVSPIIWAGLIIGYFTMGAAWAGVKWTLYCVDRAERHHEAKTQFLLNNNIKGSEIPPEYHGKWKEFVDSNYRHGQDGVQFEPLQVRRHKSTIIMWMTYWPFSGLWTLVNDPVRRIFTYIYQSMVDTLQKIADKQYEKVKADIDIAKNFKKPDAEPVEPRSGNRPW